MTEDVLNGAVGEVERVEKLCLRCQYLEMGKVKIIG